MAGGAPRVCGDDPRETDYLLLIMNVLPAYAGMIRHRVGGRTSTPRAPRVCGDDPDEQHVADRGCQCSPRMRG